jgi:hypothetical protein
MAAQGTPNSAIGDTNMTGFPIAWEQTPSIDQLSDTSPYSLIEIEDYLIINHYHMARQTTTTYRPPNF